MLLMANRTVFVFLHFLSLLLLQSYLSSFATAKISNITTDQSALLALKAYISHDPYHLLTRNWSTSVSVCNWVGVTCGSKHHRVTALNLSYVGFVGTIPPHIGNLSFLIILNIRNNSFQGSIPDELSNLYRLEILNIQFNNFSGEIPSWMTSFTKLQKLFLYGNNFVGTIPPNIGNLSFLVSLSVGNNSFHGSIPNELSRLHRLEFLDFGYNGFSGEIPSWMGLLTKLRYLYLDNNSFVGTIPPSLSNISSLQLISLAYNQLSGSIPSSIFNISSLQGIFLGANKLSGSMPSTFFNMPSLQAIDLVDNKLSGALPMLMFDNLPNIQYFSITGNQFSGQLPPTLHKCRELQILSLSRNYFTGRLLPETGNLTMLIELYLGDNNFEDLVGHISDFGISKLLSDGVSLTQTMTLATIGYMAPEYGSEGVVSTMGDVYSFGILLMETFTKKKPTDDMFSEGMSLKKLVEESMLSLSVVEVADAKLLRNESDYVAMEECLSLTMGLALGCCTDSPEQRIDTKNISTTLNKIKLKFLKNIGG